MNILTYDIEEWYAEETLYGDRKEKYAEYFFKALSALHAAKR